MEITPYLLTLMVEDHSNGRKNLETIENNIYEVKDEFELQRAINDELGFNEDNGVSVYSLTDFMDNFNDEYISDVACWVGYVWLKS